MQEIKIRKRRKCFIVNVGCQKFFFITKEAMMMEISAYIDNPKEVTNEYWNFQEETEVNRLEGAPPPARESSETSMRDRLYPIGVMSEERDTPETAEEVRKSMAEDRQKIADK